MKAASLPIVASSLGALLCAPLAAQVTQRVSVSSHGAQGNGTSWHGPITPDARYSGFSSTATNLVPGDTNGTWDVFVRDRRAGSTERASVSSTGDQANAQSMFISLSADGRYVVFDSFATNLVPGEIGQHQDVFIHDRRSGATERVSVSSAGLQGNNDSGGGQVTPDGRCVVFLSAATNFVPGVPHGLLLVYVRDRQAGTTELVSASPNGMPPDGGSEGLSPEISDDGRYVTFSSWATNLVPGDTNGMKDVFVHDRWNGTTERVSVSSTGTQGGRVSDFPSMSADGRFVTFTSSANTLVPGGTDGYFDILVHDRQNHTTERVSVDLMGVQGNGSSYLSSISADGRYVAFDSYASNLVQGDVNDTMDVFVHDRSTHVTELVSVSSSGQRADSVCTGPKISADGRYVEFQGPAGNLVPGDTNHDWDVFVRDRFGGAAFSSTCAPGSGGVAACPCLNPPNGLHGGCDNSSGTGGATLYASGGTFLSSDSLVLSTRGETPAGLSLVMQGNATIPNGVAYGQGVRCVGGTLLRRLFVKQAFAGSITAPEFEANEPTISARSAARGDVIRPGESRWYFVSYRDPVVLGGCPASSTFNATQTGEVTWSP